MEWLHYKQIDFFDYNKMIVKRMSMFMVLQELFLLISMATVFLDNIARYSYNIICYIITLAVALASLALTLAYDRKKISQNVLLCFHFLFLLYMTSYGIFISWLDFSRGGQVSVYLCVVLCLTVFFIYSVPFVIIFNIVSCAAFLAVLKNTDYIGLGFIMNISFFTFFSIVGSLVKTNIYVKEREGAAKLQYLSYHDNLTTLLNRNALHSYYQGMVGKTSFVMLIDIDDFKKINDGYGHLQGDKILQKVASAFLDVFPADSVFRFGGDEFLILATEVNDGWKEKLIQTLNGEPLISGAYCTCPIPKDSDELFSSLDAALYSVKNNGKNDLISVPYV